MEIPDVSKHPLTPTNNPLIRYSAPSYQALVVTQTASKNQSPRPQVHIIITIGKKPFNSMCEDIHSVYFSLEYKNIALNKFLIKHML